MMTSSNGNIFRVTGPLCGEFTGPGEFPTQRSVTRSFDLYFDLRLNKRLSKQSRGWWFETLSCSLWRHRNVTLRAGSPLVLGNGLSPIRRLIITRNQGSLIVNCVHWRNLQWNLNQNTIIFINKNAACQIAASIGVHIYLPVYVETLGLGGSLMVDFQASLSLYINVEPTTYR